MTMVMRVGTLPELLQVLCIRPARYKEAVCCIEMFFSENSYFSFHNRLTKIFHKDAGSFIKFHRMQFDERRQIASQLFPDTDDEVFSGTHFPFQEIYIHV